MARVMFSRSTRGERRGPSSFKRAWHALASGSTIKRHCEGCMLLEEECGRGDRWSGVRRSGGYPLMVFGDLVAVWRSEWVSTLFLRECGFCREI